VPRVRLEVVRSHAEGVARPVIGAPSQHARAPPHELGTGSTAVGLSRHLPPPIRGGGEVAELLVRRALTAQWRVAVRRELRRPSVISVISARLHHQGRLALRTHRVCRHASACAGADDHRIVLLLILCSMLVLLSAEQDTKVVVCGCCESSPGSCGLAGLYAP